MADYGDIYSLWTSNKVEYLIQVFGYVRLNYKTKEDLSRLLALSKSDRVIIKKWQPAEPGTLFSSEPYREVTLEEVCEIFGSRMTAENHNPRDESHKLEPPKTIDLLSKEVIEWRTSA